MPDFAYIARNLQGAKVTGVVAAASQREALTLLSGQSLFPISVAEETEKKSQLSLRFLTGRVSGQTLAQTFSQLAALLRSGVPLLRSLKVMRDQSTNHKLKEILVDVAARVED